jgi:large subunit ribosomal protein L17
LTNERIQTTDAKAKETRRLAERTITWARRVGDILSKKADRRTPDESARVVHAVRMARRVLRDRVAVTKLFDDIAPRYAARRGGYTRIVKIGQRPGDAAPMSLLELMPDDAPKAPKTTDKGTEKAAKTPKAKAETTGKAQAPAKKAAAAKSETASKKKTKSEE